MSTTKRRVDWDAELRRRGWHRTRFNGGMGWSFDVDNGMGALTYRREKGWMLVVGNRVGCNYDFAIDLPGPKTVKQLDALLTMLGADR